MITLARNGVTLDLSDRLIWTDEYAWSPVATEVRWGTTGAVQIHVGTRQAGRPITLDGRDIRQLAANELRATFGVVPQVIDAARERGLNVVDATCPYVKKVHVAAERLVREGYRVIVVGEPGHPEVEGILGHAGDDAQVVSCTADADALSLKGKVGLVVQTTQTAQNLAEVVAAITPRVQELRVINTICAATSERQQAAATLANRCDCMVIVGGKNSGNTRRLAQICADACERTHHIEEASELETAWFTDAHHIGITAGASTPQEHIERAVARIKELCRESWTRPYPHTPPRWPITGAAATPSRVRARSLKTCVPNRPHGMWVSSRACACLRSTASS